MLGINILERLGWSFVYRMLSVVCIVLILGLVAITMFKDYLYVSWNLLLSLIQPEDFLLPKEQVQRMALSMFPGSIVFCFFSFWCLTWQIAKRFVQYKKPLDLSRFVLPQPILVLFLIVWGLKLSLYFFRQDQFFFLDQLVTTFLLSNTSKILLCFVILSALGIVEFVMRKSNWSRLVRLYLRLLLIFIIFCGTVMVFIEAIIPGLEIALICFLLLSALPILELWINFRKENEKR